MSANKTMKKYILGIGVAALLATGCAGLNQSTDTGKRIQTAARLAAFVGSSEFLRQNPNARGGFEKAREDLVILENAEHVDFITLLQIIQRLPVKELHSERGVMIITATTLVLQDYAANLPVEKLDELKPLAKAIREGIDLALNQ
jgi:hypothetical protein